MSNDSEKPAAGADRHQWFVRMSNGSTFGPINTKGLVFWAEEGRIMPDDEVSEDRTTWRPAQELLDLGMDTLVERPDGSFAGPFHPHAIQPLIREGKFPPNAKTFHRDELPAMLAARQMALFGEAAPPTVADAAPEDAVKPAAKGRDTERAALKRENQRLSERVAELETLLDDLRVQARATQAEQARESETRQSATEALRAELAAAHARCAEGALREAVLREQLAELTADRETDAARAARLSAELVQAKSDYTDLLTFSNTRDAEYAARLAAAEAGAAAATGEPVVGDARRIQALETQLVEARRELEEARQRLQTAAAAAAHAARPNEPEIARIEFFADVALGTLRTVLEQERSRNEEARAAGAARQEALHADIERLERALRMAPGEETRAQQLERRNDRLIAKLKQELEVARRQHQAELHQTAERQRELEQRANAIEKREAAAREQLSQAEQRMVDHDSLTSQLRRRENALLTAEHEFATARQQWQAVETALMRRIEELEGGDSRLLAEMHQSAERQRELEQRANAIEKWEAAAREQLARAEQRVVDHDALTNQLRHRENALLTAEHEFATARQQWQAVETVLMRRIEELEGSASHRSADPQAQSTPPVTRPIAFQAKPWMRLQR